MKCSTALRAVFLDTEYEQHFDPNTILWLLQATRAIHPRAGRLQLGNLFLWTSDGSQKISAEALPAFYHPHLLYRKALAAESRDQLFLE